MYEGTKFVCITGTQGGYCAIDELEDLFLVMFIMILRRRCNIIYLKSLLIPSNIILHGSSLFLVSYVYVYGLSTSSRLGLGTKAVVGSRQGQRRKMRQIIDIVCSVVGVGIQVAWHLVVNLHSIVV